MVMGIYKNEYNIIPFLENFRTEIAPYIDDYEIIMVNDGSPDNSWDTLKKVAEEDSHIKVIRLSRNYGAFEAVFTGFKYATGDCITVKGVDLQEPPELTINMYSRWKQGEKVVLAVREKRNDSFITNITSNLYYKIIRRFAQKNMPNGGFDTYLIDRKVKDILIAMDERNSPLSLQILWVGFDPKYEYYERKDRKIGKSSWSKEKKLKFSIDSLIGFSYVPIRIMTYIGVVSWIVSILFALHLVIDNIMGKVDVKGYTTIVVLILFFSGMIMATLGILGEYLWRTLENTKKRPIAIVAETRNIDEDSVG